MTTPDAPLKFTIPMDLSGGAAGKAQRSLMSAFPTAAQLTAMLKDRLSLRLECLVAPGNLNKQTFDLLCWAEREGRVNDLFQAAYQENPTCPELVEFVKGYATK